MHEKKTPPTSSPPFTAAATTYTPPPFDPPDAPANTAFASLTVARRKLLLQMHQQASKVYSATNSDHLALKAAGCAMSVTIGTTPTLVLASLGVDVAVMAHLAGELP